MSTRMRVACRCGRPLMYIIGEATGACRVQVDCPRCQYLVWRAYKAAGETLAKRDVMVVHTVDLPAAGVAASVVLTLDGGSAEAGHSMRQRPAGDLSRALAGSPSEP